MAERAGALYGRPLVGFAAGVAFDEIGTVHRSLPSAVELLDLAFLSGKLIKKPIPYSF